MCNPLCACDKCIELPVEWTKMEISQDELQLAYPNCFQICPHAHLNEEACDDCEIAQIFNQLF
jgi:hypothetical protein